MTETQIYTLSELETEIDYTNFLKHTFQKIMLSKKDMCELLDISSVTLNRRISELQNIPNFVKSSESKTARVQFPVSEVAKYLYTINSQAISFSVRYNTTHER